jgi:hypothetical protein
VGSFASSPCRKFNSSGANSYGFSEAIVSKLSSG